MEAYISLLQDSVSAIGIWFVVFFLFIENVPIVGLIAPGLTVLVLSGFFYELLVTHPLQLFLIAWATMIVADTTWFLLGYYGGTKLAFLRTIAAQSPNASEVLTKQPWYILLCYQFFPYFRMFLPFSLGLFQFSLGKWLILTTVGSGLYTAVFLGIGVAGALIATEVDVIDAVVSNINYVLALGATVYAVVLFRRYRHNKKDLE